MLLADSAQEIGGKLYILGGGWSVTGPEVTPMALGIKIDVPWNATNQRHEFQLTLLSEDGHAPPMLSNEGVVAGEVSFEGHFEVGRPPGVPPGTDIDATLAVQLGPLPLVPGKGYLWQITIDGSTDELWKRPFRVRPASGS